MKLKKMATVVIAAKAGRLGNRLFLSAYFMANALAKGYTLWNPALGEYASYFEGSVRDPFCRFPEQSITLEEEFAAQCREVAFGWIAEVGPLLAKSGVVGVGELDIHRSHDRHDEAYDLIGEKFDRLLRSNRWLLVKGWKFRDDSNLVRFHAEISAYFRPVEAIRHQAEMVVTAASQLGERIVGVHIRQGDYRSWKNGVHYFETEQYAHWMKELAGLHDDKKVVFIICSSDPIDRSHFQGLNIVDGPGTVVSDLYTLSLCDAIMGPPSTFSTWASYYGRVPLCMLQHAGQKISMADFVFHDRV
jgi:hypothetical protein